MFIIYLGIYFISCPVSYFLDGINIARIEELGTWNMQVGLAGSMLLLPNFLGCAVM